MIIATKKDLKKRKSDMSMSKSNSIANSPKSCNSPNLSVSSPIKIKRKSIFDVNNNKNNPPITEENDKKQNENIRRDQKGIPIMKESKLHKISFCDKLTEKRNLTDVIEIESYKKYNVIEDEEEHRSKTLSCRCIIF